LFYIRQKIKPKILQIQKAVSFSVANKKLSENLKTKNKDKDQAKIIA
jgi:hypothetical protein